MTLHRSLLLAALLAFAASSSSAEEATISLEPSSPTAAEALTVTVEFASIDFYNLESSLVQGSELVVVLHVEPCLILCPVSNYEFEVPFAPLAAGSWHVRVETQHGDLLGQLDFIVAEPDVNPARARLVIEPEAPTDADRVQVLIPSEVLPCAGSPSVAEVDRHGNIVEITLLTPQDGGTICVPVPAYLAANQVDLGQLEPGSYSVVLRIDDGVGEPGSVAVEALGVDVTDAPDEVVLLDRYRVRVDWTTAQGSGQGRPVADASEQSALFTFFDLVNWEVMVKVLDACAVNDHRWVFLAAATDVEYTVTIDDLEQPGQSFVYTNPAGQRSEAVTEVEAFPCDP